MSRSKNPSVSELSAWIDEELTACRFNFATNNGDNNTEAAAFFARRVGYLEAALEVVGWFNDHKD
jgi:hypothetical protein